MPARIDPVQTPADRRADRHARTLNQVKVKPSIDKRVIEYHNQGYVPLQISMLLDMSVSDVKLSLAMAAKRATSP